MIKIRFKAVFVLSIIACQAFAARVELKTPTVWEGFVSYSNNYISNTTDIRVGNPPGTLYNTMGVVKFPIEIIDPCDPNYGDSILKEAVTSAKLHLWVSRVLDAGGDGTYLQLQHLTKDIAGVLVRNDASSSASVENIGELVSLATCDYTGSVPGTRLTWDVTEAVEADRLLGHQASSFRIRMVDANGNPVVGVDNDIACICSQDSASGYSKPYPDYYPRIIVDDQQVTTNLVFTDTDFEGYAGYYLNMHNTSGYLLAGNDNTIGYSKQVVLKFPLSGVEVNDLVGAKLKLWLCQVWLGSTGYDGAYIKLQHYTYNNNSSVSDSDGHSENVEDVGDVVKLTSSQMGSLVEFEITPQLMEDIRNGFAYSSFRVVPVDSSGNRIPSGDNTAFTPYGAVFYSQDNWGTLSGMTADITRFPRLTVKYFQIPFIVKPDTDKEAYAEGNGWYEPVSDQQIIIGQINSLNWNYKGILKFSLEDIKEDTTQVTLKLWRTLVSDPTNVDNNNGVYVQLKHFTTNSEGPAILENVIESDYPTENVGSPVLVYPGSLGDSNSLYEWDVRSYVNADIAAGFSNSSFKLVAVDASGNETAGEGNTNTVGNIYKVVFQSHDPNGGAHGASVDPNYGPILEFYFDPLDCSQVHLLGYGYLGDINKDCKVNLLDYALLAMDWAKCTNPAGLNCDVDESETVHEIPQGTANINGNVNEWSDRDNWIPIQTNIYGSPDSNTQGKMALRWDGTTNKIYGAVIVQDTMHYFISVYDDWNKSDRIEVFSQGDAAGGTYWNSTSDAAQQYFVGFNAAGTSLWAFWPGGYDIETQAGFQYAGSIVGDQIIYEFAVTQFDNYAERFGSEGTTQVTQLQSGNYVNFDVVIDDRYGSGSAQFGSLATTSAIGRASNADSFLHLKLVNSLSCGAWGYVNGDVNNDCYVNFADVSEFVEKWLQCNNPVVELCN